ncbi:MAG TPA: FadR/GntR family transcriptional regulator [Planctomycetota bacterium]|nr:FadR/GntR family transcriptional regulator [Planctomycetota bacterium]
MKESPLVDPDEPSLVRRAEDRLRKEILKRGAHEILPSQGEIAASLGVSRIVVREAMKHLEAEGLVEIAQGRRIRIRPADSQASVRTLEAMLRRSDGSLAHLLEVRRPLEGEIAALCAVRISDEQVCVLERTIVDLQTQKTLEARVETDLLFHRTMAEATANPVFPLLLATIEGLLRASRYASIGTHGVDAALEGHREILHALRARDSQAAREAMLRHLRYNERQLKKTPLW